MKILPSLQTQGHSEVCWVLTVQMRNQSDGCLQVADIVIENNSEDVASYIKKFHEALTSLGI